MKKSNSSRKSHKNKKNRKIVIVIVLFVLSIAVSVGISTMLLRNSEEIARSEFVNKWAQSVVNANRSIPRKAPIASYSDVSFIPEANIQFQNSLYVQLRYTYTSAERVGSVVFLSDELLLNASETNFLISNSFEDSANHVPLMQACTRVFAVTFEDTSPASLYEGYEFTMKKQLADGRTAYIWKTSETACDDTVPDEYDLFGDLQAVVETIESY